MRILTYEDLKPVKGIPDSRTTIWRKVKSGKFPRPVKIGENRNGWIDAEVDNHIAQLAAARDEVAT